MPTDKPANFHTGSPVVARRFQTHDHVRRSGLKIKAHQSCNERASCVSVSEASLQEQLLITPLFRAHVGHFFRSLTTAAMNPPPVWRDEYLGRSRECHLVYAHVHSDRSPRRWTVSRQNIDDSRWKPGLSKQYKRKQSLAEITTEPSKTAGGVGESGPNPAALPGQNRGNKKKKKVHKTWQWKRRKEEKGTDANTVFLGGDKGL